MSRLTAGQRRSRAAAALLVAALLAPSLLSAAASGGVVVSFVEGPSPLLAAVGPPGNATMRFQNPSRALNASVDVSTESTLRATTLPAPTLARWSEWMACPTLNESASAFTGTPLSGVELNRLTTFDGFNWTQPTTAFGCGVLFVEFDTGIAQDPLGAPFLDITVNVAADATAVAGQSNITLALFETPAVGRAFTRALPLAPSPTTPGLFSGSLAHPPLVGGGPQRFVDLALFCPDGGYNLTVDQVSVTMRVPVDPKSPQLVVRSTGAPVWQFRGPGGIDAYFGRTLTDASGGTSAFFGASGPTIDGSTAPLFVAEDAQVRSAYFDVLPEAFTDSRANASGGTNYTVKALTGTSLPAAPAVDGFPIYAHPVQGTVTLYGLIAHGLIDAEQTVSTTFQTAGNVSNNNRSVAQTFTVGQDGSIESIELWLANATGHPVGALVLELRTATADGPDNASIATASVNATAARLGGWVNFTFTPAVSVTQGQLLAAVLSSPGATLGQTWEWNGHNGLSTDPYAFGFANISQASNGTGPWFSAGSNVDMSFRVRMRGAFNDSLAPLVQPAGYSGSPARMDNYSGALTGWTWTVPGQAIDFTADFQGGGIWQVPIVDGLDIDVEYQWDAAIEFALAPRAVELAVGTRAAFLTIAELNHREVVDFTAELQAALLAGDFVVVQQGANVLWLVPLRVHADGPGNITLAAFDVAYSATVTVTGFGLAINTALVPAPPGPPAVDVALALQAPLGAVRLSNLHVDTSEAPFSLSLVQPPVFIPEGSVNATVADLNQWFNDDGGLAALTFSVTGVTPSSATAAIFRSPLDANLTVTLTDGSFFGNMSITVRAVDETGLFVSRVFNATVVSVDDPPVFAPLPDAVLQGTTGSYDFSGFLSDEDTQPASVTVTVSSIFATLSGFNLTFDYRNAPANFTSETLTLWANDGHTNVSAPLRVFINNAGRPHLTYPGPITVAVGHNLSLELDGFAQDDVDPDSSLVWAVVISAGVTSTPGSAEVRVNATGRTLFIRPLVPGEVDVNLSVRDAEGNLAVGTIRLHVIANTAPSFGTLGGASFQLAANGELRIPLGAYLSDEDDAFSNFSFNRAWTGAGADVSIEGGDLVIRPVGVQGGIVNVSVIAVDSGGLTAAATFTVVVAPGTTPGGGGEWLAPLLFIFGALAIGGLLYVSARKGKARRPTLSSMEREDADIDEGEEDEGPAKPKLPGLEKTDDDRMLDDLDRMEREAAMPKIQLPPVTLFGVAHAKASMLLLLYRDGRPISWGATSSPTDEDREAAQELGAALRDEAVAPGASDRKEWGSIEREGRKMIVEGRAQLVLGAVLSPGADEAIVRLNMRAALERIFDEHADQLKRWDGSRKGLGGVDDVLESLLRR